MTDTEEEKALQKRALEMGLFIGTDKFGRYYLGLSPEEVAARQKRDKRDGSLNINPWLVLCAVTLDEVRSYVDAHAGEHRFLDPGEVYGVLMQGAPEVSDEPTSAEPEEDREPDAKFVKIAEAILEPFKSVFKGTEADYIELVRLIAVAFDIACGMKRMMSVEEFSDRLAGIKNRLVLDRITRAYNACAHGMQAEEITPVFLDARG